MENVRTVSETKHTFYTLHQRPINSIYRRFVEELTIEMHLLSVHARFSYDPIYAFGVVSAYDRFMQGYRPEADLVPIFNALCQSVGGDPQQYERDAKRMEEVARSLSPAETLEWLSRSRTFPQFGDLQPYLETISEEQNFKYSRLFAIGLYHFLQANDSDSVAEEEKYKVAFEKIAAGLHLPFEKILKDLQLYRSNLDKMNQAQSVMQDILEAERRKRQQRALEKKAVEEPC